MSGIRVGIGSEGLVRHGGGESQILLRRSGRRIALHLFLQNPLDHRVGDRVGAGFDKGMALLRTGHQCSAFGNVTNPAVMLFNRFVVDAADEIQHLRVGLDYIGRKTAGRR